ncbi:fasciclin domain-containing protein [Mucilaginibacter sp. UR6-1]|uniref:fasciclin domain-containing protein n=1 Tax=Mucilaginibacter sp. UR6-1 TaxID=1435643 RepID=UPI001E4D2304|nr:fasciclin domain-containing protein [Mucilaginibacter sp. UR6-1]MCC8409462.1 fasciclin domain-containing protein [Mucilaginibacter sp. UR6-1]
MKKVHLLNISGMHLLLIMMMGLAAITGCQKDDAINAQAASEDGNTIKFVLNDNFNFSMANAAVNNVRLNSILAEKGPYTFFVPNNNAFASVSITEQSRLSFYSNSQLTNLMSYGIVNEKLELKKLPLTDNKAFKTRSGGNIYISKYLNGTDTVITVNGVQIISTDNPASNGTVQVLPQMMNPEVYSKVTGYLRADTSVTLFNAALERSGLSTTLLNGNDVYTLLAPSNLAFQQSAQLGLNLGISTLDSIVHAQPARLAALLRYHIIKGRYFDNDFFNLSNNGTKAITMLSGGEMNIGGLQGGFKAINFIAGGANGIPAQIYVPVTYSPTTINVNLPCGNGVVHIINRVLIP